MRLRTIRKQTRQLVPDERHRFPARSTHGHVDREAVQLDGFAVVSLTVGCVGGIAKLSDLGAALRVDGERRRRDVRRVERDERAVECI